MKKPLRLQAVSKAFGRHTVLTQLDLDVAAGEAVVLLGPNGAGKSTLLGCVCGTVVPDTGRVEIDGHDLVGAPLQARAALRYLPQEVEVPPGLTGTELIAFYAEVHGALGDVKRCAAATQLDGSTLARLATTYSVGMRRRLAFGCLLAGEGALYVLDEPFAGVDRDAREQIHAQLRELMDRGAGLLMAAHDQDLDDLDDLGARRFTLTPSEPPEGHG